MARTDFDKKFEDFDEKFKRVEKFAVVWAIIVALLALGFLGSGVYVVIRILQYFGIL